jgi:DNA-binding NarL/FixJ family response regulator
MDMYREFDAYSPAITCGPSNAINTPSVEPSTVKLSPRQREVLDFIMLGRSNKEIARALGIAEGTVKIHVAALFQKLGLHHRAAVAFVGVAMSEGGIL